MNPRTQSVVLLAGAIKNRKVSWGPISQPVSTQMELKVQHGMLMLMCELKSGTNKENSFKFALPCTEPIMLYRVFLLAEASPILSEAVMTDFAYSCFPVQEDPEVIAAQERVNQILPPGTLKNALVAIPPLNGPRALLCCERKAGSSMVDPLSRSTLNVASSTRWGLANCLRNWSLTPAVAAAALS